MKKLLLILAVIIAGLVITGCASSLSFLGTQTIINGDVSVTRSGEATNTVYLGLFGKETYPSAQQVARDNGISRIATVERYSKLGVLGLWIEYTTVVSGQ